jgi:hypothetical protein
MSLAAVEEQLRQERRTRQQAESQLQQERSTLEDARAALQCERSTQEKAHGQLQWERTTLGDFRAKLQLRDLEITRLIRELVQEVVSFEELCNTGEEKEATILELQKAAETARAAL